MKSVKFDLVFVSTGIAVFAAGFFLWRRHKASQGQQTQIAGEKLVSFGVRG